MSANAKGSLLVACGPNSRGPDGASLATMLYKNTYLPHTFYGRRGGHRVSSHWHQGPSPADDTFVDIEGWPDDESG